MFRNGRPSEMLRRKAEAGAGSGGTPTGGGATGTPAGDQKGTGEGSGQQPAGAGPQGATGEGGGMSLEQALAELEKARKALKDVNGESAARRKRLEELETAEQARQQAQMSEAEKAVAAQKALTDKIVAYEQQVQALRQETVRYEVMLAAQGLSVIDLDAAYRLLDLGSLEFDEATGKPTNVEKALKDLINAKPYLVKQEQKGSGMGTPAPQQQQRKPGGTPTGTGERRVTPL